MNELHLAAILLALVTLPGTLYLALLTVAGARAVPAPCCVHLQGRLAIIVPAHDEATGIARTLTNMLALARTDGDAEVVVVADNCSDDTAAIARGCGARVLERCDPLRRGKGYALDYAFRALLPERHLAYVIIDADSVAADNLLASMRNHFAAGALAVQARYTVLNGDATARTGLTEVALAAFNVLRPRARSRLGLSAGILGNGFALRREVLERLPYNAVSVVEDLEYHHDLVSAGIRVVFADDTAVRGEMPTGDQGRRSQRARWEGGRLRLLLAYGPSLTIAALRGKPRLLEPLAELLLLPLGYHAMLLLAALTLAVVATDPVLVAVTTAGLSVMALHVIVAVRAAGLPWSHLRALARVPAYLAWKLTMLATILAGAAPGRAWIRTNRDGS